MKRLIIRLCCRVGIVVFKDGHYRFLGGRKLRPDEISLVDHKIVKYRFNRFLTVNGVDG